MTMAQQRAAEWAAWREHRWADLKEPQMVPEWGNLMDRKWDYWRVARRDGTKGAQRAVLRAGHWDERRAGCWDGPRAA